MWVVSLTVAADASRPNARERLAVIVAQGTDLGAGSVSGRTNG
ncbi:hypothetical protein MCHIJ_18780 [Mycolicibacterium chitae]|nr:hypothetical protein [Mycolicibacterium chitae]BBZ02441.1 hypothetical protein MCHIJ_18780 [Mycolicibacterium chitae]